MSEINLFDALANRPYQIIVKDNDGKYSTCEITKNKEVAVSIATIYLKTYKYVKIIYVPTGKIIWEAGDNFKNDITTLREGELVQLKDNCVLEEEKMTDFEYDLQLNMEWVPSEFGDPGLGVDYKTMANNLSNIGYQKIIWHDVMKELPELNKNVSAYSEYVLGYDAKNSKFAVVSWDGSDWSDDNGICYNVAYWAELPKINLKR